MTTEEAYERILREVDAAGHVITERGQIDKRSFGSFVVGFIMDGRPHRFVNDRGQIIHDWGTDFREGHLFIDSFRELAGEAFSAAIRAELK